VALGPIYKVIEVGITLIATKKNLPVFGQYMTYDHVLRAEKECVKERYPTQKRKFDQYCAITWKRC